MIKIDKIELHNFRFFIDKEEHNNFVPNSSGMLVYGENGSGKSSLYKAFEFLVQPNIDIVKFNENINIFNTDNTYLKFDFSNEETLMIDSDHLSLENDFPFIQELSIPRPLLDYKSLLKVHYRTNQTDNEINIYTLFEKLLEDYSIGEDGKKLKELRGQAYFDALEDIVKNQLFNNINLFLEKFEHGFKIENIAFDAFEREIILKIEYFNSNIEKYHIFLNEARLSALAIAIYFAIIKKQFDYLGDNSLKILVLDDLLISLDMNNRLNLIEILKDEFNDFQIFFFTHDKALFEIFKDKMSWQSYEIYVDEHEEGFEIPFVKKSNSLIEQAKYQKHQKNYDCSANLLRQYTEKLLCKFLPADKLVNKNCKQLDLNGLLQNAVAFENSKEEKSQTIISILESLKTYRNTVLNPASHYDDVNVYKSELHNIILALDELESKISI